MEAIDAYIAAQPAAVRPDLEQLRETLLAALPDAEERFTYNMPTLWQGGGVIQFKVNRDHLAVYPGEEAIHRFADQLSGYTTSTAGVQIPWEGGLPYDLIVDLARWSLGVVQGQNPAEQELHPGTGDAY